MTIARHERVALGVLLLVAAAIRIPLVGQLPLDFASMRQYHSAMIARDMYFRMNPGAGPASRREAAADYVAQATIPEPSIVERIAAIGYVATGGERLWIPRAQSTLYWLIGALFLYGAGRRLGGRAAGLVAATVQLFLPYGIAASLSFQPDSLAVMWMCGSLYGLVRYAGEGTIRAMAIAVALAMPAILIRPMTACFLFPAMAAAAWSGADGDAVRARRHSAWLALSAAPAIVYFAGRFFTDATFGARVGATFVPGLFLEPSFWRGWAGLAWRAFGPVLFVTALAGALFAARGRTRAILVSLWIGYAFYGAAFNLHISTHPYYQTLAVPMVALSVAVLVAAIAGDTRALMTLAVPAAVAALLLASGVRQRTFAPQAEPERVHSYEAVGRATNHSRHVIFLTDNWGVPLRYHADVSGRYWPSRFEIQMYRPLGASGIPDIDAAARLAEFARQPGGAAYFAVTDLDEFARQPDLRALLETYTVVERTDRYVIYNLTR